MSAVKHVSIWQSDPGRNSWAMTVVTDDGKSRFVDLDLFDLTVERDVDEYGDPTGWAVAIDEGLMNAIVESGPDGVFSIDPGLRANTAGLLRRIGRHGNLNHGKTKKDQLAGVVNSKWGYRTTEQRITNLMALDGRLK